MTQVLDLVGETSSIILNLTGSHEWFNQVTTTYICSLLILFSEDTLAVHIIIGLSNNYFGYLVTAFVN